MKYLQRHKRRLINLCSFCCYFFLLVCRTILDHYHWLTAWYFHFLRFRLFFNWIFINTVLWTKNHPLNCRCCRIFACSKSFLRLLSDVLRDYGISRDNTIFLLLWTFLTDILFIVTNRSTAFQCTYAWLTLFFSSFDHPCLKGMSKSCRCHVWWHARLWLLELGLLLWNIHRPIAHITFPAVFILFSFVLVFLPKNLAYASKSIWVYTISRLRLIRFVSLLKKLGAIQLKVH